MLDEHVCELEHEGRVTSRTSVSFDSQYRDILRGGETEERNLTFLLKCLFKLNPRASGGKNQVLPSEPSAAGDKGMLGAG